MRRHLPLGVRQEIRHGWRRWNGRAQKITFEKSVGALRKQSVIGITQPIMPSDFFENKVRNITRGAALLNQNLVGKKGTGHFGIASAVPMQPMDFYQGETLSGASLLPLPVVGFASCLRWCITWPCLVG
jgi:hypothetical protein